MSAEKSKLHVSPVMIGGELVTPGPIEETVPETTSVTTTATADITTTEEAPQTVENIVAAAQKEKRDLTESERKFVLDYSYPLPDGFPSEDQLHEWKAQYGDLLVHRIAPGEAYVIRSLSRGEFRRYASELEKRFPEGLSGIDARLTQEEMLVERCTLWPEVTTKQLRGETNPIHKIAIAGTITVLAYDINDISNLTDESIGPVEEV